jgi:hypothetical protein
MVSAVQAWAGGAASVTSAGRRVGRSLPVRATESDNLSKLSKCDWPEGGTLLIFKTITRYP